MKNFQISLFVFLFVFAACQGEPTPQVKEVVNTTKTEVANSNPSQSNSETSSKPEAAVDMQETKLDKPKVIEFYVEEDKKKTDTKAKKSSSSAKPTDKKTAAKKKSTSSKKTAKMKFENDTYAFGIIKPGDVIEHKFEFTNTGNKDLVITNAEATCGCTQPSFPFIPIPPGEKGYIGVKYDSTGKLGSQKPTVTLTTNAYPKTQKVYLEGVVISKMSN
jgi:hypothetical protein